MHRYVYQFPLPSLLHECDPEVRVGFPVTPSGISLSAWWYLYPSAEGPRGRSWHVFICIGYTLKVALLFSGVLFKHSWSLSVDRSCHRYVLVKWSIFRRRKTFFISFRTKYWRRRRCSDIWQCNNACFITEGHDTDTLRVNILMKFIQN